MKRTVVVKLEIEFKILRLIKIINLNTHASIALRCNLFCQKRKHIENYIEIICYAKIYKITNKVV